MLKIKKRIKLYNYKKNGIIIGNNCEISHLAYLDCHRPNKKVSLIKIGNNVRISRWAMIVVSETIDLKNMSIPWKKRKIKFDPISIGNNVFIGAQTIVLPGARIGNNVIVGANSVVKGPVPPNVIVAGSPIRIIKKNPEPINNEK